MDIDLDFCDDKIESFLKTKLEEVRLHNASLEDVLLKRKEIKYSANPNERNVNVKQDIWKKIFNNKYCLCYEIDNYGTDAIQVINVLLWRNIKESFNYKTEICIELEKSDCLPEKCLSISNMIQKSSVFRSRALLVVVFDVPNFLQTLDVTVSGCILYKIDSQEFELHLPNVQISPSDFSSTFMQITSNDIKNILTLQTCSNEDNLVLILPEEWDSSLSNTFEIHCSLMKIAVASCSEYFISYNISKLFDNSLVQVHQIAKNRYFLKVYTNNNNQLLALLHHFNYSIPNIAILPHMYYNRYLCKNAVFSNELLQEFCKSLNNELEVGYKCVQQSGINSTEDMLLLKKKLYETEKQSDELFLKLSNVKY